MYWSAPGGGRQDLNLEQVQTGEPESVFTAPIPLPQSYLKKKIGTRRPLESGVKELIYLQLFLLLLNKQKKMATIVPVMTL